MTTTVDPTTHATGAITLAARHRTPDTATWWLHTLIAFTTYLVRLGVWHAGYEWYQLRYRDRTALTAGVVLALSAVLCMVLS